MGGGQEGASPAPPNQAGVQTNTLLIPRPEKGIWDFTGNVGPSHSSFKTKALRERPAPPRHPGRRQRHCLPATPSRQPAPPPRHWDQLGGTGSSNGARTTGLVCTDPPSPRQHQPSPNPAGLGAGSATALGTRGRPLCPWPPLLANATAQAHPPSRGTGIGDKLAPRSGGALCVSPGSSSETAVPPVGQGGSRAPLGAGDHARMRQGFPPRCPQQPPPRPGTTNLTSKGVPPARSLPGEGQRLSGVK